jgi:hypothetical protein
MGTGRGKVGGGDREKNGAASRAEASMKIESGWNATSKVLDGEAIARPDGYAASTDERVLFVSHANAGDAAQAVWLCRQQGIIRRKLPTQARAADILYATTLPVPQLEN